MFYRPKGAILTLRIKLLIKSKKIREYSTMNVIERIRTGSIVALSTKWSRIEKTR